MHALERSYTRVLPMSLLCGCLAALLVLAGCGPAEDDSTIVITPVGNEMLYEVEQFTVQAGQEVRLVFDNSATTDPAMLHNVVILNTNDPEVGDEVGEQAVMAGQEADWVPDHDAVITYTPMADPGERAEVTFTAPEEPGEYLFLCTYPGHYITMRGTMVVEPAAD